MENQMKKRFGLFLGLLLAFGVVNGFAKDNAKKDQSITIVYTNDIHSYIGNEKTNKETKEKFPGLRVSKVSQMVKDMRAEGMNVLLVDAGDEIQGCTFGSIDKGQSVIEIMNAAGYQIATPGNHEFDYGTDYFFNLKKSAKYPFVSCNFKSTSPLSKNNKFDSYKIFKIGGKKVAVIGISTPETITSSTPVYFQDKDGNFIYEIKGIDNPQDLYDSVQKAIDSVKNKADYVIALGHLGVGVDELRLKISSMDVIANTTGLLAFIDAHSHTTMESSLVKDKAGNDVLLTQTGAYLTAAGILTIDENGKASSKLVNDYEKADEAVAALEEKLIQKVNVELGQKIAVLGNELHINRPGDEKHRYIRSQEMNAGDFVSDSVYWYFNELKGNNCDIALTNGGGIRNYIVPGDVKLSDVKSVAPFGNMICLINATGQQIKDALEMGVTVTGLWDEKWDIPAENGGFLQVAGMRYTIDPNVKSSIVVDGKGLFKSVDGDYRVKNIEVFNKTTGEYEPLDVNKTYAVGGVNYILRNSGNGLSMFSSCQTVVDFVGQDFEVLAEYFKSFKKDGDYAYITTENSPLAGYKGYQLDYTNPYGAGRIKIEELTK